MRNKVMIVGVNDEMPGLRNTLVQDAHTRMAQTPTVTTIGKPTDVGVVTHAPTIKSTGIAVLDRNLNGGLPAGSVVYMSVDSKSMSEVFLYQFTQARKTYYITTGRRPRYVAWDVQNMGYDISDVTFIDAYSEYYTTAQGDLVDNVGNEYVDKQITEFMINTLRNIQIEEELGDINIIIDTISFFLGLNVNTGEIKKLMNVIYETTKETNGLAYLYGLKETHNPALENEIINSCDAVFDVELHRGSDEVISRLTIPKIRGRTPVTDLLKFRIGDGIQIDTSTDIA
ncbi:MAG: ATPase domain-containing protein [Euryarchaeota archaeon]|nr:ATPase domain-containing protein [Euryarchaeota archaeon]